MVTAKGPDSNHEKTLIKMIDQYQIALLQMCYMYMHDRELAEDAVQETFLKAYKSMSVFRGDCSEKTWLNTPGWNRQYDRASPTPLPLKSYTLSAGPTPSV